jgi:hypothetical protein
MDTSRLRIEAKPAFADMQFLEDCLYEYNAEKTGLTTDSGWRFFSGMTSTLFRQGSEAGPGVAVVTSALSGCIRTCEARV